MPALRAVSADTDEGARPIVVLMVDDEPLTAQAAMRMLAMDPGIRFHACVDPTNACALADELHPTLILQDLVMPETDGISMVRAFRANPSTRDLPIIVLSSEQGSSAKAAAFAAGADDYLVKFPDRIEMLARIRHHADRYARRLAHREEVEALAESQRTLAAQSRFLRETFDRYLSPPVVERLLQSPEGLRLGGDRRKVTIMMTDIRGFTAISERLPPERMLALINNYLDVMTDIIVHYQGTIDEFIGDAILALFGAPEQRPDDAERAVACAVEMQLAMLEVNARNRAEGLPEVEMGIGLNTGEVMVGNIGSSKRAKFAVVGSAVNLTARIESYTTGGQILISQATLDEAGPGVIVDERMEVMPKGLKKPVSIHRVGGIRGRYNLRIRRVAPEMVSPAADIRARFTVIDGKDTGGDAVEGHVVRMSKQCAEIFSPVNPAAFANLKVQLLSTDGRVLVDDVYGKVLEGTSGLGTFLLRFTSIPTEAFALLETHRAAVAA